MGQQDVVMYLKCRGLKDASYCAFVQEGLPYDQVFNLCSINGFDFMVSHFLDSSSVTGYGLIPTNETLGLNNSCFLAIALIEGDDVVCLEVNTGRIYLILMQTGNGEQIEVASSFTDFWGMCIMS